MTLLDIKDKIHTFLIENGFERPKTGLIRIDSDYRYYQKGKVIVFSCPTPCGSLGIMSYKDNGNRRTIYSAFHETAKDKKPFRRLVKDPGNLAKEHNEHISQEFLDDIAKMTNPKTEILLGFPNVNNFQTFEIDVRTKEA